MAIAVNSLSNCIASIGIMNEHIVRGYYVDAFNDKIFPAEITIKDGFIAKVEEKDRLDDPEGFIMPGFIDSHVHIESSMLVPSEFARLAVVHGTVATVSDPHEIANVCGMDGVRFMIENGESVNFNFYFGAPSCVPATNFETAGATIDTKEVDKLLSMDKIAYLSEMMDYPGTISRQKQIMEKIASAKKYGKPIDGHAPGLQGAEAEQYFSTGISTDHECFTEEEALGKLALGVKILIREGSAAKNFDALIRLLSAYPDEIMFCSDDKHPDELLQGHIDRLCARAVSAGHSWKNIVKAACINPVLHYKLDVGLVRIGDPADFIIVKNLDSFACKKTFIKGKVVAEHGKSLIAPIAVPLINRFEIGYISKEDLAVLENETIVVDGKIPVIKVLDGQLVTEKHWWTPTDEKDVSLGDVQKDIIKIAVVNRYRKAPIAKAFIHNTGLRHGAIASSVAHDSHNIVAVGTDDGSLAKAINLIIEQKGGIAAVSTDDIEMSIGLPVAGLMTDKDGFSTAKAYTEIDAFVKEKIGTSLRSPFMSLSFMALLVIPHIKLSDKGLFDCDGFRLFKSGSRE